MGKTLFVISDLHLGGAEGFQMCSSAGRARLARFIDWAASQKGNGVEPHLVLNGDIVDFLAEEDETGFTAFVVDEKIARRKLTRIAEVCEEVFAAVRRFTAAGNRLTLLIGNHDVELSLPAVRRHFLGLFGDGRVEYLYDNEAFTVGPVLIEHGNRYDGWNMVNHGELRQIRSQLSRGEKPRVFSAQPGSELVARIMNPVKKQFAFVDLLKPETGGVLPILAVLNPGLWQEMGIAMRERAAAWYRGWFTEEGLPERADYVAARKGPITQAQLIPENLRTGFDEADKAAAEALPRGGQVGRVKDVAVGVLLKKFRDWRGKADLTFRVDYEDAEYLKPAREHAQLFRVVVFGHTHLAKRIDLGNGRLYLNTGTWADIMRIPAAVYEGDEGAGVQALTRFLDDVEKNNITGFRRQVATFARIDLDESEQLQSADVFFFDDNGHSERLSDAGIQERLA
ncbi:MAG: metallophosphoesterase [Burkholderiales bacterium]